MSVPGSHTAANFLPKLAILVILSGIVYLILSRLNVKNFSQTSSDVFNQLTAAGMVSEIAGYATSQSAFETAGFTSPLYKSNNNLFGMKYAGQDQALGEKNGFADYATPENSVIDFVNWYHIARNNIFSLPLVINNLQKYVSFLKNRNYFEADETLYYQGCKYYYDKMFNS
jgi:uncharacterized FlgJ-related protein